MARKKSSQWLVRPGLGVSDPGERACVLGSESGVIMVLWL